MKQGPLARRAFLQTLAATGSVCLAGTLLAQERAALKEPVFRIANAKSSVGGAAPVHPLDPALEIAADCLKRCQSQVVDYTATVVKRERVKGSVGDYEYVFTKIRNRKTDEAGKVTVPLSVYMKFLKPNNIQGREVIWVEGRNGNKLHAHEGGLIGRTLPSVSLDPDGMLAMRGQLHPIYEIGIENLILKLIERGEREKQHQEVEVKFEPGAKINGRPCTVLSVKHPIQRPHFEFYLAQVFIDDEYKLPVRYAAYGWPKAGDRSNPVLEEYTYLDVKFNVGLEEADFDANNPNYKF